MRPESAFSAWETLRLHDGGRATSTVELVGLKAMTRDDVALSPPSCGSSETEALPSQDKAMGQLEEKPKG